MRQSEEARRVRAPPIRFAPTRMVFQSSNRTFFMGKWGAFMLQNLVTMVKRSRAKGSPLYKGDAKGER